MSMTQDEEVMYNAAKSAFDQAYVPYSKFHVGAAVKTKDGKIYSGCNIENASYGLTNCAERTAIFKAVSDGYREFESIMVIGDTEGGCKPCGACRQVMSEFINKEASVYLTNIKGEIERYTMEQILPYSFEKEDM
ncbi:cytidine deaminase [Companilactobacillus sp. RD055328]|uniref:cytidine deaminase n=1 Tax=Companilactobacillus sp. RD055328 TaxID=2916634 RepID=UPI001FC834BC|nr:cytidine deaminase [Companilactobacillus sp. RD055328]GKQ42659.1 cytidine deaminase [Companilactobacillus sp. RD055328]